MKDEHINEKQKNEHNIKQQKKNMKMNIVKRKMQKKGGKNVKKCNIKNVKWKN